MKLNLTECTTCSIIKNQKSIIEHLQKTVDKLTEENQRLLREKIKWGPCACLN